MKDIETIGVVGGGTMGQGIAEYFAMKGYPVSVYEPNASLRDELAHRVERDLEVLEKYGLLSADAIGKALQNLTVCDTLDAAVADADFIIEAIPENIQLKQQLFNQLEQITKPTAVIASNTSSLNLFDMMKSVSEDGRKRCMVCHWYNPAHLMPLVELSDFGNMDEEVLRKIEVLFTNAGKKTIRVLKNIPGLIANRIQQGIAREVFSLIEMKAASAEDIDAALKYGPAFRYATTGQLEVADFGGLDIWCTVGDNLLPAMSNSTKSSDLLREKVSENKLGLKTGEGFFEYKESKESILENFQKKLIIQLKSLDEMNKGS